MLLCRSCAVRLCTAVLSTSWPCTRSAGHDQGRSMLQTIMLQTTWCAPGNYGAGDPHDRMCCTCTAVAQPWHLRSAPWQRGRRNSLQAQWAAPVPEGCPALQWKAWLAGHSFRSRVDKWPRSQSMQQNCCQAGRCTVWSNYTTVDLNFEVAPTRR